MTSVGPDRAAAQHVLAGGHDTGDRQREPELGDRAQRRHDRRAAGHVGLLADDVRLRLQEVAARVERDGLADEREPRRVRRAGRLVPEHEQQRRGRAASADGGERAEPGLGRVDDLGAEPRDRRRPLCEPGGGDHVRGRVDELAGGVGPAARRAPRGRRRAPRSSSHAADHEALDAARRLAAAPAAAVVAADDARPRPARAPAPRRGGAATCRAPTRPSRRRGTRAPPAPRPCAARRRRARAPRRPAGRRPCTRWRPGRPSASARSGAPSSDARDPAADGDQVGPGRKGIVRCYFDRRIIVNATLIGGTMTWVKPKFEIVELCSEVTSYLHRR